MDNVIRGHAARVRAADPLVAGHDELPGAGGVRFETRDAAGLASVDRIDQENLRASWSPPVVHRLQARVGGPDPEAALGGLLDRWMAGLRDPGPGQALAVSWPSRDTAPVRALAVRGFAPISVAAVRRLGEREVSAPAVRRATPDDAEAVVRMYERLVAYDAQFGWVAVRDSTPARIKELVASEVLPLEWCWIAEAGSRPVGCVIVQPPGRSRWIGKDVRDAPVAYLGVMYVEPAWRGRGVGPALVDVAHRHAAAQGVVSMMLHHALPNPLSTPFWARRGYRPLTTQWVLHLR
ncbi:GNAT family N-acetyltransferase [Nonomuraea deserti]|uniref:GNAT family N-acetyltransferase n=1 Tax=Nonomuraea deserti TaxID=1848322 RepID=A0A4R4WB08_9ACTN|nr:GNAT family N-acetyltransferase [Nonomuraea deserti]TDD12455.1 GNAT family N-acetyltransferase [Nonomuraea deserti]